MYCIKKNVNLYSAQFEDSNIRLKKKMKVIRNLVHFAIKLIICIKY